MKPDLEKSSTDLVKCHNEIISRGGHRQRLERRSLYISRGEMKPRHKLLVITCTNPLVVFEGLKPGDLELYRNTGVVVREDDPSLAAALCAFLGHREIRKNRHIALCLEYPDGLNQFIMDGRINGFPELLSWSELEKPIIQRAVEDWKSGRHPIRFKGNPKTFSPDALDHLSMPIWRAFWRDLTIRLVRERMKRISRFPIIKDQLDSILIHGWIYDAQTGVIDIVPPLTKESGS